MGTYLRKLSNTYPMNTNMTGFRWFSKNFAALSFGRNSLIIERVNVGHMAELGKLMLRS